MEHTDRSALRSIVDVDIEIWRGETTKSESIDLELELYEPQPNCHETETVEIPNSRNCNRNHDRQLNASWTSAIATRICDHFQIDDGARRCESILLTVNWHCALRIWMIFELSNTVFFVCKLFRELAETAVQTAQEEIKCILFVFTKPLAINYQLPTDWLIIINCKCESSETNWCLFRSFVWLAVVQSEISSKWFWKYHQL